MSFQLNRQIGYTQSWLSTVVIASIVGAVFCFILVFLQPFDTYDVEMPYKKLKLVGYYFPIVLSILGIHIFENLWYKKSQRWYLYHEVIVMILGTFIITLFSFLYLNHVVNESVLPWSEFYSWFVSFGLPFAPILLLLWTYLRFRFSTIQLRTNKSNLDASYEVTGTNSNERYTFRWNDFIMAKSQSNYVELFLIETNNPKKVIIRSTLSKVMNQLPEAIQVHRSYIINLHKLEKIEGNVRKGWCILNGLDEQIPVSPKHFKALKEQLQIHP